MDIPIPWSDVQAAIESTLSSDVLATGLAVIVGIAIAGMIIAEVRKALTR